MLTLPASVRIHVAAEPVDLRLGFDGLAAATRRLIEQSPMNGHLFVLLNRRRNRVKVLVWDRTGWLVLYKRLERGTFALPIARRLGQIRARGFRGQDEDEPALDLVQHRGGELLPQRPALVEAELSRGGQPLDAVEPADQEQWPGYPAVTVLQRHQPAPTMRPASDLDGRSRFPVVEAIEDRGRVRLDISRPSRSRNN